MHDLAEDDVMSPHTHMEANHFQLEAMFEAFLSSPQAPQTVFTKHSFDNLGVSCSTYQLDAEGRKCHLSAILLRFTCPLEDLPGGATQKCMHHPNTLTLNAC
jgi:hypothetical protein